RYVMSLLDAYRHDDTRALVSPTFARDANNDRYVIAQGLTFLCERGIEAPDHLLKFASHLIEERPMDWFARSLEIAQALAAGDDARLAAAIEEAEAHGLLPHAARMRITLAQHTGNRGQLDRARPVLERLGDRQFLRRLAEVEAALQ